MREIIAYTGKVSIKRYSSLLGAIIIFMLPVYAHAAASPVEIWWPTEGTHLTGTQPLKGLQQGYGVEDYDMYWQVDGGDLISMYTSYDDYPHKEAIVDFSGWNWKGAGPYTLTFIARSKAGVELGRVARSIYVDKNPASNNGATAPAAVSANPSIPTNPLFGKTLYVDKNSAAANQVSQWSLSKPDDAALLRKIADNSSAVWLGSWLSDSALADKITSTVSAARTQGTVPTFVLYNIPSRDCGSYSAGGTNSPSGYSAWITKVAQDLGKNTSIVILEPDALAQIACLSPAGQDTRFRLLRDAVTTLKATTGAVVYLDAGHSGWIAADVMSGNLKKAGIDTADGFSLNVSNFYSTDANISFGKEISSQTGNKHFVIDTSRNGRGSNGEWCNPSGRALGQKPTTSTGESLVDAYLWIKIPGESDGTCSAGPSAGSWWADYALGLTSRASW